MGNSFRGEIDFTKICRLWREHKELFRTVDFKDGAHALLRVDFNERQQPDDHGNTHYLRASCKKDMRKDGVDYYIGSQFKPSEDNGQRQPAPASTDSPKDDSDLPF